jgi:hypothetical protein
VLIGGAGRFHLLKKAYFSVSRTCFPIMRARILVFLLCARASKIPLYVFSSAGVGRDNYPNPNNPHHSSYIGSPIPQNASMKHQEATVKHTNTPIALDIRLLTHSLLLYFSNIMLYKSINMLDTPHIFYLNLSLNVRILLVLLSIPCGCIVKRVSKIV